MNLQVKDKEEEFKKNTSNEQSTNCKFCNHPIDLTTTKKLPKKLIIERYGLCWAGLEKLYLIIFKIRCPACNKKYSHKVFRNEYYYK